MSAIKRMGLEVFDADGNEIQPFAADSWEWQRRQVDWLIESHAPVFKLYDAIAAVAHDASHMKPGQQETETIAEALAIAIGSINALVAAISATAPAGEGR